MSCSTVSHSWEMLPIKNLIKVDRDRLDIRQVGSEAAKTTNMSYLRLGLETPEENLYHRGDKQAEAAGYYSDMMRLPQSLSVWNRIWCRTKSLIKMGVNNQKEEHGVCLPAASIIFLCPPWFSAWVLSPQPFNAWWKACPSVCLPTSAFKRFPLLYLSVRLPFICLIPPSHKNCWHYQRREERVKSLDRCRYALSASQLWSEPHRFCRGQAGRRGGG